MTLTQLEKDINTQKMEEWADKYPFAAYMMFTKDTYEQKVAHAESIYLNQQFYKYVCSLYCMSHEAQRLRRLEYIKTRLKLKCSDDDIIVGCCRIWGCSRRTMLEYLKILKAKKGTA